MNLLSVFFVTILSFGFASIIAIDTSGASVSGAPNCHDLFESKVAAISFATAPAPPRSRPQGDEDAELSSLMAQLFKATGQDAVMDYFISGIYLNALLIDRVYPGAVEAHIVQRARQELPGRKMGDQVLDLAEAIQGQPPLRKDIVVYRGQGSNVPPPGNGTIYEVGEVLKFPQFLSTSPDLYLAESYVKGILLQITVPKGVRALNVQKFLGMKESSFELLFARGTSLKIVKIERVDGEDFTKITAEMLPPR